MEKLFAVYKPKGPTSYAIVEKVKKLSGEKRVGHAGTLDPLASGVLVLGIGREATKKLAGIAASEKEYVVKIKLGETSTTDDAEGEKKRAETKKPPSPREVEAALRKFAGEIMQVPPAYSAVKVRGKPAYKYARSGRSVELKPRKVFVKSIEILEYSYPFLELKVVCGKGVYIRSLARDLGREFGTGGYVLELERTRVGDFTKERAVDSGKLEQLLASAAKS